MPVQKSPKHDTLATSEPPSILKLPDDILVIILDLATFKDSYPARRRDYALHQRHYGICHSLALVNRRFNRMVVEFLFECVDVFDFHTWKESGDSEDCNPFMVPAGPRATKVHQRLRDQPALRQWVKSLRLDLYDGVDTGSHDFDLAKDLLSWSKNLRVLQISKMSERDWDDATVTGANASALVSCASRNLPAVKVLELGLMTLNFGVTIALGHAMETIDFSALETLSISPTGGSDSDQISKMRSSPKLGCGPFTKLQLTTCRDDPEAIWWFLRWPKALSDLTINIVNEPDLTLNSLNRYLEPHRQTLQSLNIGLVGYPPGMGLNVSQFPCLETLSLSRTQIGEEPDSINLEWHASHAELLLGPKLRKFVLVMGYQGMCHINDWGSREEQWIIQLARAAKDRKAALEWIEIVFEPSGPDPSFSEGAYGDWEWTWEWPWARFEWLEGEIGRYGIALDRSKPRWTRDEWLELTKQISLDEPSDE
ncbi:hypothetical protein N7492_004912 [Penicillium capsulatum]|uniref:Uncharacterized protein n=1 Tax=Penicillium capsulatum TaxID=69766 RepID=A0A9W9I8H5_9EURO|nr:hypothetical protein N7492_004912 [Penicillium capsulatum]KAJ6135980.1 hypothetical protein N7512_001140 [Penicillium capsulatum]